MIEPLSVAVLQTPRLTLCPCSLGDREDFMALERDPEVMRFLNGGLAVDNEAGDPNASFLMPRGTEVHVWAARRRANGAFVGWFCLWPESERLAELGYRLRRADWGQGLATEGGAALVHWGFETDRYDQVFASTLVANTGSRRVMEKIGLAYERTVFAEGFEAMAGSEPEEVVYTLMRSGWTGSVVRTAQLP